MNQDVNYLGPVSALGVEDRSSFIWKCYAHVVMAILAFGAIDIDQRLDNGGRLVGRIVQHLDLQAFSRPIEANNRLNETFHNQRLVIDRQLHCYPRKTCDLRTWHRVFTVAEKERG